MKRHLNLMSSRSSVRACVRKRLWQWSIALASLTMLLVPVWLLSWWPVNQKGQLVAKLEAQYEPLRQLSQASKEFRKRIELVRAQEKTALALAKIDTPVVTLLGLVSQAVAESQGRVFIKDLGFQQSATVLSERQHDTTALITLAGQGFDKESVHRLTKVLKTALPFANVKLDNSKPQYINEQQIEQFLLECSF